MIYRKPIYHPLALEALQKLADEDIVCTPDEILWLHHEARRAARGGPGESTMLDYPLICGNTALWPLTLGADAWLTNHAAPAYTAGAQTKMQTICIAFAMAHARRPEIFMPLTTRSRIIWRTSYWAAGLTCTLRELAAAVDRVLGVDEVDLVDIPTPKEKSQISNLKSQIPDCSGYGDTIALLCHFYGGTPAQWLWQEPAERINQLLDQIQRFVPGSDKDDSMARCVAQQRFRAVVAKIRADHSGS